MNSIQNCNKKRVPQNKRKRKVCKIFKGSSTLHLRKTLILSQSKIPQERKGNLVSISNKNTEPKQVTQFQRSLRMGALLYQIVTSHSICELHMYILNEHIYCMLQYVIVYQYISTKLQYSEKCGHMQEQGNRSWNRTETKKHNCSYSVSILFVVIEERSRAKSSHYVSPNIPLLRMSRTQGRC